MRHSKWNGKVLALSIAVSIAVTGITVPAKADTLSELKTAMEQAQTELNIAETEYQQAQEVYAQAKSASDAAKAKEALGSYGFFEEYGYTDAMNVLKDQASWVTTYTQIGGEKDATGLENFKATVAHLKKCNQLRQLEGKDPISKSPLSDLKVNMKMMAISEVQANWSTDHIAHIGNAGLPDYNYSVAENLAWAWGFASFDPFEGWYTEEKQIWNDAMANTSAYPELASCKSAYQVYQKYNSLYHNVGHYLNIVDATKNVTGYAISTYQRAYQITCEQSFSYSQDYITVSDFETKLNAYCQSIENAILAYDTAKTTLEQKQAVVESKETVFLAAKQAYVSAGGSITSPSPSTKPTTSPSAKPSTSTSAKPSTSTSIAPSTSPSNSASASPLPSTQISAGPSTGVIPSTLPSTSPSTMPSINPSSAVSVSPSGLPSIVPSAGTFPSTVPSGAPSTAPSINPSSEVSVSPSGLPSSVPSAGTSPSILPSGVPDINPSTAPIELPSLTPQSGEMKVDGMTYIVTIVTRKSIPNKKKVKKIVLNKNVNAIGPYAFKGCKKLKTLVIKSTKLTSKSVSKNAFKGLTKVTTIKVPKKKLKAYKKLLRKKGLSKTVKVKGI